MSRQAQVRAVLLVVEVLRWEEAEEAGWKARELVAAPVLIDSVWCGVPIGEDDDEDGDGTECVGGAGDSVYSGGGAPNQPPPANSSDGKDDAYSGRKNVGWEKSNIEPPNCVVSSVSGDVALESPTKV